ncbi:MAG: hypothetical protein ABSA77_07470 [Thermoguttaceae bacterium]
MKYIIRKCFNWKIFKVSKPTGCYPWALWRMRGLNAAIAVSVLSSLAFAQQVEVEAFTGKPYGVGRITVDLPETMLPQPLGAEGLALTERDGRVLYPAVETPAFGKVMKEVLDSDTPLTRGGPVREQVGGLLRGMLDRPPRTTIFFLFRGDEPLRVTLQARQPIPINVMPRQAPPAVFQRLLNQWWRRYAHAPQLLEQNPDYPPLVENYLITTLAAKLNLRLPEAKQTNSPYAQLQKEIGLNLGTEQIRTALQQDRILGLNNLDTGRVFLSPFRQFQQFPVAARHAGQMGRRCAEPYRPARVGSPDAPAHGKATRAQADRSFPDAGPDGRCRRGDYRHRHVLPRGGGVRLFVRGPQQRYFRREFHCPTLRSRQCRRRDRTENQNLRS